MSNMIDNALAMRILLMLVTPFEKTKAFETGVIDKNGKVLVDPTHRSFEQQQSYDMLDRIVFSLKRLLAKIPGGSSKIASLTAAYWLVKENLNNDREIEEEELVEVIRQIENGLHLVEEELEIERFLKEQEGGAPAGGVSGSPANVTGAGVQTGTNPQPIKGIGIIRRKKPLLVGVKGTGVVK